MTGPSFIVGVDLGQAFDYTAVCVLQQGSRLAESEGRGSVERTYQARHLERLPLGTSYPAQVERIREIVLRLPASPVKPRLVVDQTGVGRPVVDMLRLAGQDRLMAVSIHGGDQTTRDGLEWRVPKRELVSVLQVLLQSKRLEVAKQLPDAETLVKEMLAFKVTIASNGHDSYSNDWRENPHDDLVLATALAAWAGERVATVRAAPQTSFSTYLSDWR